MATLNFPKKSFKSLLTFLVIAILVTFSQIIVLEPHLKYGFSDVDWGFLTAYTVHKRVHPNPLENFIGSFRNWGIYTHQEYYIGFQSEFFGLDFRSYQMTTHFLKTLATIIAYPLLLSLTGSMVAAFIGTTLFAVSYSSVGTMYTVVTSSDYLAVISMIIFFWFYYFILKNNKGKWFWNVSALVLLLLTLYLSTERMYPILFWIILIEIFFIYKNKSSPIYLMYALKRSLIFFSPFILVLIFHPKVYSGFLVGNGSILLKKMLEGDWYNLLRPFISMGGLIIPNSYWKYLGVVKSESLDVYIKYFLEGPIVIFILITLVLAILIFRESLKFIMHTLILTIFMALTVFWLGTTHVTHFDESLISLAIFGGYMTILGLVSLFHYLKYQPKDRLVINMSTGLLFALSYLFLTWVASDLSETPTGAHRYLTIPILAVSLSLGSLMALATKRILSLKGAARLLIVIPILILIVTIRIWSTEVSNFFNGQLSQGFGAYDKQNMRGQLLSYLDNLSDNERSLFYFDSSDDLINGYFYDNTLLAGLGSWILWHEKINFKHQLQPDAIWGQYEQLKTAKSEKDGKQGFNFRNNFYSIENFYAFKLKDKKVINVKEETLKKLNINNY